MKIASYYLRVTNECFISRTTATFIRKSIGHIGVFFNTERWILSYHDGIADVLCLPISIDEGLSSKQTVFQQPTIHINMYNKNCMYPFVNCMYCKFPRINDSWFLSHYLHQCRPKWLTHHMASEGQIEIIHLSTHEYKATICSAVDWHASCLIKWCGDLMCLTHLPLDKMAAISQTIFWEAFSWM